MTKKYLANACVYGVAMAAEVFANGRKHSPKCAKT